MTWTCRISLPEGVWIALPLEGDPVERATDLAADLGEGLEPDQVAAMRADLEAMTVQIQKRDALLAAVLLTPDGDEVLALLFASPVLPDLEGVAPLLEALAEEFRVPDAGVLGQPSISLVDLPAGRALRVHQRVGVLDADEAPVVESLTYIVESDIAAPELLSLTASWVALSVGEVLVELVQRIADTLVIEPADADA